ncbi:hypothetical protein H310_13495 [Aphanomyces invadans]|uniref:Uncharacterized protein n=1 Tax=Aphanomyces invadans TaxID=157072 RepID=A0A024TDJ5_9STRA|nr:hypothetical protein H310_13495 [Aphanomyces invadans]ETV92074.1 hypothetical protein H310_13495 [Aphanomyces invadans]|eukprot:XP_008879236.1 hypothetical protein H310_13495 [Aphanomyces invadans]
METVVTVPMPLMVVAGQEAGQDHPLTPPGPSELDELRKQNVERAAASSSEFNKMTYEQMAQFHAQQQAMALRFRREQEESHAILSKKQEQLRRQQEEIKMAMAQQARVTGDHRLLLQQAYEAMRQLHTKVEELDMKQHPAQEAPAVMSRPETLIGVQQVPLVPMYKGSTKPLNRGVGGILFLMPVS